MLKYILPFVCFFAICNGGLIISPVAQVSRKINNPFGIVEGIIPCAATGRIVQTRITDCTVVPCTLVATRQYTISLDFIPFASHAGLELTATLIHQGVEHVILDGSIPASAVEAGLQYTFAYTITVTGFQTGLSDLKVEIAGNNQSTNEVCGIAGINVVPP